MMREYVCVVQACRLVCELVCLCLWDMLDRVFVCVCVVVHMCGREGREEWARVPCLC